MGFRTISGVTSASNLLCALASRRMTVLFPHDTIRPVQDSLVIAVAKAVRDRTHLVAHAPTGLGKTAAALAPSIGFALKENLTVFFLTSRNTQHHIAIETARAIKDRHKVSFGIASIVGKQHMCSQSGVSGLTSGDFAQYCKSMREDDKCEFYLNAHATPKIASEALTAELVKSSPLPAEDVLSRCSSARMCPYEISLAMAQRATLIIADYYYLFHPHIRQAFLARIQKDLGRCIIIVDEGHNLPQRAKDLLTLTLSTRTVRSALKALRERQLHGLAGHVEGLGQQLANLGDSVSVGAERIVDKAEFINCVSRIAPYEKLIAEVSVAAETAQDEERTGAIETLASFLDAWRGAGDAFARILQRENDSISLTLRCLDPSIATKEVIAQSWCTMLMSGTLIPTRMFRDLLGFPATAPCEEFPSPFPRENRLSLVIPETTTKFSARSDDQYRSIARRVMDISRETPGSAAFFFPSYRIRDAVYAFCDDMGKDCLLEQPGMPKEEKSALLQRLRGSVLRPAALLAVTAGSFGEGIDLPGVFQAVTIVGLPLDRPDLETQERIRYYDARYGKGWDYGYTLPALNKVLQNAGRCIRTERDRGVIIFLDERYAWPRYLSCIPQDWQTKITKEFTQQMRAFFAAQSH